MRSAGSRVRPARSPASKGPDPCSGHWHASRHHRQGLGQFEAGEVGADLSGQPCPVHVVALTCSARHLADHSDIGDESDVIDVIDVILSDGQLQAICTADE